MAARVRDVVWAESAKNALDEVIEYIAQDSPAGAARVLDEALRLGTSLARFVERGRIVPELNEPSIRELFVFKYRLLYQVQERRVLIVGFLHGARDFVNWQRSQDQE